jgi:hypothetical protein
MLNDKPPSLASQLPQGFVLYSETETPALGRGFFAALQA